MVDGTLKTSVWLCDYLSKPFVTEVSWMALQKTTSWKTEGIVEVNQVKQLLL